MAWSGFERLREALGGFGKFCEVLKALDGFVMLWDALALEGFGKLLKSLGRLWEALASAWYVPYRRSGRLREVLGPSGRPWEALGGFGKLWDALEGFGILCKIFECFGILWKILGGFGSLCETL